VRSPLFGRCARRRSGSGRRSDLALGQRAQPPSHGRWWGQKCGRNCPPRVIAYERPQSRHSPRGYIVRDAPTLSSRWHVLESHRRRKRPSWSRRRNPASQRPERIEAPLAGSTPNRRCACDGVNESPGLSVNSTRTRSTTVVTLSNEANCDDISTHFLRDWSVLRLCVVYTPWRDCIDNKLRRRMHLCKPPDGDHARNEPFTLAVTPTRARSSVG
jgi:hypothetical protein